MSCLQLRRGAGRDGQVLQALDGLGRLPAPGRQPGGALPACRIKAQLQGISVWLCHCQPPHEGVALRVASPGRSRPALQQPALFCKYASATINGHEQQSAGMASAQAPKGGVAAWANKQSRKTSSNSMHMCAAKKPLFMKVGQFCLVKDVMDYLAGMKHPKAPWLGAAAIQRWPLMVSKQHWPKTINFCDSFPTVYCTCHGQKCSVLAGIQFGSTCRRQHMY